MPDAARFEALAGNQDALLSAGGNLDRIFNTVVHHSLAAIPQAHGAIVELLEADALFYRAASGSARRYVGRRLPVAGSLAGRSIAAETPIMVTDLEQETEIDFSRYREVGMRALMTVPFTHGKHGIGALKFYSREPAAFAALDLTIARLVAGQLITSLATLQERTAVHDSTEIVTRLQTISETVPQLIWTMTSAGRPIGYNARARTFLRLDQHGAGGIDMATLFGMDCPDLMSCWSRARADRRPFAFECRLLSSDGTARWFLIDLAPITIDGRDTDEWIGVGTDIDERKRLEISLQDAVQSRELLLSEVNHRTKNSLQIITGLLALHASRIGHPEAKARLMDARAQIGTIAQVHEAISQTSQHDQVEFVSLLRSLATSLIGNGALRRAQLLFEAPDHLMLPIDRGVPVALIAGEIVTNAIKHATARADARISIFISEMEGDCIVDIADNGPGMPPHFDPEHSSGLGMDIIFGLAKQAGGHIAIDSDARGTRFRLHLPR